VLLIRNQEVVIVLELFGVNISFMATAV